MEQERSIDRLARYLIGVGTIARHAAAAEDYH